MDIYYMNRVVFYLAPFWDLKTSYPKFLIVLQHKVQFPISLGLRRPGLLFPRAPGGFRLRTHLDPCPPVLWKLRRGRLTQLQS